MDNKYLATVVGLPLKLCLAELLTKRPVDPIEWIAHWLYRYMDGELYYSECQENVKGEYMAHYENYEEGTLRVSNLKRLMVEQKKINFLEVKAAREGHAVLKAFSTSRGTLNMSALGRVFVTEMKKTIPLEDFLALNEHTTTKTSESTSNIGEHIFGERGLSAYITIPDQGDGPQDEGPEDTMYMNFLGQEIPLDLPESDDLAIKLDEKKNDDFKQTEGPTAVKIKEASDSTIPPPHKNEGFAHFLDKINDVFEERRPSQTDIETELKARFAEDVGSGIKDHRLHAQEAMRKSFHKAVDKVKVMLKGRVSVAESGLLDKMHEVAQELNSKDKQVTMRQIARVLTKKDAGGTKNEKITAPSRDEIKGAILDARIEVKELNKVSHLHKTLSAKSFKKVTPSLTQGFHDRNLNKEIFSGDSQSSEGEDLGEEDQSGEGEEDANGEMVASINDEYDKLRSTMYDTGDERNRDRATRKPTLHDGWEKKFEGKNVLFNTNSDGSLELETLEIEGELLPVTYDDFGNVLDYTYDLDGHMVKYDRGTDGSFLSKMGSFRGTIRGWARETVTGLNAEMEEIEEERGERKTVLGGERRTVLLPYGDVWRMMSRATMNLNSNWNAEWSLDCNLRMICSHPLLGKIESRKPTVPKVPRWWHKDHPGLPENGFYDPEAYFEEKEEPNENEEIDRRTRAYIEA